MSRKIVFCLMLISAFFEALGAQYDTKTSTLDNLVSERAVVDFNNPDSVVHDTICPQYTVNVGLNSDTLGLCSGSGVYNHGAVVQIMAMPKKGTRFVRWSDGNLENPRTLVVTDNIDLVAVINHNTIDLGDLEVIPEDEDDGSGFI